MSFMINSKLEEDEDPEVSKRLPINPDSEDIFFNMADGLLLIKLLNLVDENAVDMRTINKYTNNMNAVAIKINVNQALTAAKGFLKLVGVNDTAFTNQNKGIILGVLIQLARLLAVKDIDLAHCAELYRLKYEDEEMEDFNKLKPEDILIRWVNHHLKEAGQERRIKNLGKDIADGEAMTYVLHQLDKSPSNENEERLNRTTLEPLSEEDLVKRNNMMIDESKKIGVKEVCQGKDLVKGNAKVNTIFVAEVFNTRHGLTITEEERAEVEKFGNDYDDGEGNAEERAFRLWINSLGIEDVFIEKSLYDECNDGVYLLKVCHRIKDGSVDWKKVVGEDPMFGQKKKIEKMGPFDHKINTQLAFEACEDVIGKKQHGIGGDDIFKTNKKLMLALIWQLARYHALALLGSKEEKDILAWANEKAGSVCTIKSFSDSGLQSGRFLIKLCEAIDHEVIDWDIVTAGEDDEGKEANAKYAISLARKFGAFIFCVWEDVVNSKKKMMLVLISGIYDCYLNKHERKIEE